MTEVAVNLLMEAALGAVQANRDAATTLNAGPRGAADDEHDLARRLALGDAAAFDQVVALCQPRVARLASRLLGWPALADVEDVVQEVFVSVLENAGQFRGDSGLLTWISVITLNKCRTHQRGLRSWLSLIRRAPQSPSPAEVPADRPAIDAEMRERVRAAVRSLASRDREVIVLHYLEQREIKELSAMLGLKPNAVEVRLHRARQRLREKLAALIEEQ
jgi:RNA polymerase sigma-70 factor (ECF subfamily)